MRRVQLKILDPRLKGPFSLPRYATEGAAALDLRAMPRETFRLEPSEQVLVPTGIAISIGDPEIAGLVLPRSGLGSSGIVLGNLVGLIDSDYQGEILLSLWNRGKEPFEISPGMRVAQLLFISVVRVEWEVVESFSPSRRGSGGFGHSGEW